MKTLCTLAVLSVLALAGCGGGSDESIAAPTPPPAPVVFDVSGSVTVDTSVNTDGTENAPCAGRDGFDDMDEGAQVVVRDAEGTVVGRSTLEAGFAVEDAIGNFSDCQLDFNVIDVPDGSKFYSVTIADRNEMTYDRDDLDEPLELTLD